MQQAERAVESVQKVSRGEIGQLTVGFTGPAWYTILPEMVRQFRERFPQVEVVLEELCTPEQEAALQAEQIDIGFLHPPVAVQQLQLIPLRRESLIVALPEGHALANCDELPFGQLADEPFILFPRHMGPNLYAQILELCRDAGFSPNVVQEAAPQPTAVGLVAAGIGIALVAESLQNLGRPGVAYRPLQEPSPKLELAAAWHGENASPILLKFLEVIEGASLATVAL